MSIKFLQVGDRRIGTGEKTFIIAEAGINHNGSIARAKELIDAAKAAGADAVKFQKRNLAEVYQKKILDNPNIAEQKFQVLIPLLKEFELKDEGFVELERYAKKVGIMFLVNPWDKKSADTIEELLDIPLYKVGSPDLTNDELVTYIARLKKPMILSTGMSYTPEIDHVTELLQEAKVDYALLHCNSTYPAPFDEINLRFMEKLRLYNVPVGYSGHERGIAVSIGAVARGASIIERHITVDKNLDGPDHKASLLPEEFKQMVDGIREIELAIGKPEKKLSRAEVLNRELLAKSVVASRFISDGEVITRDMLTTKGPAKGLSPQKMDEIVGVKIQRDIFEGDALTEDDLKGDTLVKDFDGSDILWNWGPIVRFSDFESYLKYDSDIFEFHLTDKDLTEKIPKGNWKQEIVVHMPEYMHRTYLDLASEDKEKREIAIDTMQRSLDLTRKLAESFKGKPKFVIHPGGITLKPNSNPSKLLEIYGDSMRQLNDDGVDLLPENLPPRPWVFGGEWVSNIFLLADEIKEFLDKTGYKMCLDTSHLTLACNASGVDLVDQIKDLRPYVSHLHISDGAGIGDEGLQIGEGTIDWDKVMASLAGYKGTMVPEIWQGHLHGGRGFFLALERLKLYMK